MASPQLENGYFKIANETAEAMTRVNLSPYESRVLWFIFRKTYGFNKRTDWITLSQFSKATGIDKRHVFRALRNLKDRRIIVTYKGDGYRVRYGFQKNYEKWILSPISVTKKTVTSTGVESSPMQAISVTDTGGKLSPIQASTKDIYKNNLTKNNLIKNNSASCSKRGRQKSCLNKSQQERFDLFWLVYPRKKSKGRAEKAWKSINPDEQLVAFMMEKLEHAKRSRDWMKDGGQYIPYPATWLNEKGWLDEYPETHPLTGRVSDTTIKNIESFKHWEPPEEGFNA